MPKVYLLETGPLGLLAHDRPERRAPIQAWVLQQMTAGDTVLVSEVADFEVRRELTRLVKSGQLPASRLGRLDLLALHCGYLSVSTSMWRRAADFWADARMQGIPTADSSALDADVLIAAQASELQATVVTNNSAHIGRWVSVHPWP